MGNHHFYDVLGGFAPATVASPEMISIEIRGNPNIRYSCKIGIFYKPKDPDETWKNWDFSNSCLLVDWGDDYDESFELFFRNQSQTNPVMEIIERISFVFQCEDVPGGFRTRNQGIPGL